MSDIILKVENISKQYRLGLVGTGTISHELMIEVPKELQSMFGRCEI